MISLALQIRNFILLNIRALKESKDFIALIFSLIFIIGVSVYFYVVTEGWGILDSFYFTVTTITTVGYGDIAPKTDIGKIYTIFLIISGMGSAAAFVSVLAKHSVENQKKYFKQFNGMFPDNSKEIEA